MKYINTETGAMLESDFLISGGGWRPAETPEAEVPEQEVSTKQKWRSKRDE